MTTCHGAVILGLAQLHVGAGVSRPHTSRAAQVANALLPTPWNHLEAGMAFQLGLPLFVIREDGLTDEGIFGVGVSDRFVHHSDLSPGWLLAPEFTQPFVEWANEVRQHVLYPH